MTYDQLVNALEMLRGYSLLKGSISESGDSHLKIPCLFAPWSHEKRQDTRPSMTISYGENMRSWVKCFTCQHDMPLVDAMAKLDALAGYRMGKLTALVIESETSMRPVINLDPNGQKKKKAVWKDYGPELKAFPMAACDHPEGGSFLRSKGCPDTITRRMGLRWVPSIEIGKGEDVSYIYENAVLFPVYSYVGNDLICVGAQARSLSQKKTYSKYTTLFKFQSNFYLYGEHLLPKMGGATVFLVEGMMDMMHLLDIGVWSLGLFGLYMSEERAMKLRQASLRRIYLMLDPDSEGQKAIPRVVASAKKYGLDLSPIVPPEDPKKLVIEQFKPFI